MNLSKKRHGFLRTSIRSVDEENYRITHTINTKVLDRYGTVVLPQGVEAGHFLNNAVVLWSHNMDETTPKIPIGRCIDLDIREEEIVATTEFNKNDPLAVKVFNAYKDGFLHAWSIGFMPLKYKRFDEENREDLNQKYGLNITSEQIKDADMWGLYLIYKWELLEYSAVPVPGNPEALNADKADAFKRELVIRGLVDEKSAENLDIREALKRDEETSEEQTEDENSESQEEATDSNTSEGETEENTEETTAEEESTEETENTEETESSEKETEEAAEETSEEDETSPEESVEDNVEAEETDGEEADQTEETTEKSTESNESTEDETKDSETVAENTDTELEEQTNDKQALEQKVDELTQRNQELSERVAKMAEKINELDKLNQVLEDIKKSLDVDNIDKIREAAQKRKPGQNPETFFSDFLSV